MDPLSLLSLAGGALARLLPEGVGLIKNWQAAKEAEKDRAHERAIIALQMQREAAGHTHQMEAAALAADVDLFRSGVEATKPISGQLRTNTGVRWVDATVALLGALVDVANAAVRPIVTLYWVLVMYTAVKVAQFQMMTAAGADWPAAVNALWTSADWSVLHSIIGFWFMERALRHMPRPGA